MREKVFLKKTDGTVSKQSKHNIYEQRLHSSLIDWSKPCEKTYGGPIKRAKRTMKNLS